MAAHEHVNKMTVVSFAFGAIVGAVTTVILAETNAIGGSAKCRAAGASSNHCDAYLYTAKCKHHGDDKLSNTCP